MLNKIFYISLSLIIIFFLSTILYFGLAVANSSSPIFLLKNITKFSDNEFVNEFNNIPDTDTKDNIEHSFDASKFKVLLLFISVVSVSLTFGLKKGFQEKMLFIFSVFHGIVLSIILNLCILAVYEQEWCLWFFMEYTGVGIFNGILSYYTVIYLQKFYCFIRFKYNSIL